MVAAAKTHPEIRLTAGVDPIDDLRARFADAEGVPAFATLDEVLAGDLVDAVYVATPHQFHRQNVVDSARAGKHVIVEKPMALTVEDCTEMIAAADANGVRLIVGHTHGFIPAVGMIAGLVAAGTYGALGLIAMWNYTDFLYRPRRPEELDSSRGGGIVYNQIPHQVDILRTVAGRRAESVRAVTAVLDPERPTEGFCTAVIALEGGAGASIVYSGYDHYDSDELHGWIAEGGGDKTPDHGGARRSLAGLDARAEAVARTTRMSYGARKTTRPAHQPHFGELIVTCADADLRPSADGVTAYTTYGVVEHALPAAPWWPGRGDVLQELVDAIDGRAVRHDGRFGRETVEVCLAIARSAAERREIRLSPVEELTGA